MRVHAGQGNLTRVVGISTWDKACRVPGWNPTPRVRFPYPAWIGSWWILFHPLDCSYVMWDRSFSKLGKSLSYRQRCEKRGFPGLAPDKRAHQQNVFFSPQKHCVCSLEVPLLSLMTLEYPQHMFSWRKKISHCICTSMLENKPYLEQCKGVFQEYVHIHSSR